MKHQPKITQFMGKPCIIEQGQFPVLFSLNPKTNGMLIGIRGNNISIEGTPETQQNIANGFDPKSTSHEIFKHEKGEIDTIKYHKKQCKGVILNTMLFVNADFGQIFAKPNQESTKIAGWMKGKRHQHLK